MNISKVNPYIFSNSVSFQNKVNVCSFGGKSTFSKYGYSYKTTGQQELSSDVFEWAKGPHSKKNNKTLCVSLNESVNECLAEYSPEIFMNKYLSYKVIDNAIKTNPEISRILESKGLSPVINMRNIKGSKQQHFIDTYKYAKSIAEMNKFNQKDRAILMQAALLHDIGKALIPSEILDKPGRLTPEEREIVNLHAQLGYEILKTTDLNSNIEEAVRLHHTGITNHAKRDNVLAQVLSVADVYSALTERRSYKEAMSNKIAYTIMNSDSKLSQHYVSNIFDGKLRK